MKKAVIFDLDGTLANTLTSLAYCTNRALEDFGLQAIPQECYKKFVGNGARMQITRALRYVGAKEQPSPVRDDDGFAAVPCLLDEVYDRYMEYFAKDCLYEVKPYPGIPELLDTLAESIQGVLQDKADVTTSDALYQQMKAPLTQITRVVSLMRLLTFFTGTLRNLMLRYYGM